jgi:glutamyl-tRNA reductase
MRERLVVPREARGDALKGLAQAPGVDEIMEISTCNRVEYLSVVRGSLAGDGLIRSLAAQRGIDSVELARFSYEHRDQEAHRHLFRVVSGLDSMVLGEPQITGQVKADYQFACDQGTVGPGLHRLLHRAFHAGKRVRTDTGIGRHAVGIAYAAVQLARRIFERLDNKKVLLVGTGEMGQLACRHFRDAGASHVTIVSRSEERAREVAEELDAQPGQWSDLEEIMAGSDVVVGATDASRPLLTRPMADRIMKRRRGRSIFMIDISVPRIFDAEAGERDGVFLFDVDDLEQVAEDGRAKRREAVQLAERLLEEELAAFERELAAERVKPLVRALHLGMEREIQLEVGRTLGRLGPLLDAGAEPQARAALEALGRALTKRWLHVPVRTLKAWGREGRSTELLMATELLGLDRGELEMEGSEGEEGNEPREASG